MSNFNERSSEAPLIANRSTAIDSESPLSAPARGVSLLEKLPKELQHMIFQELLPGPRQIDLVHGGRTPSLGSLLRCNKALQQDVIGFLNSGRVTKRYVRTAKFGILEPERTLFRMGVTADHRIVVRHFCRKSEECREGVCQKKVPVQTIFREHEMHIRHLQLWLSTPDTTRDRTEPNCMAVKSAWNLSNLETLNIYAGTITKSWGLAPNRARVLRYIRHQRKLFPNRCSFIPLAPSFFVAWEKPASGKAVVTVWDSQTSGKGGVPVLSYDFKRPLGDVLVLTEKDKKEAEAKDEADGDA